MTTPDSPSPVLEEAAQAFADATAKPPYLFDLSVEDGRRTVDSTQDRDFPDPPATRPDRRDPPPQPPLPLRLAGGGRPRARRLPPGQRLPRPGAHPPGPYRARRS